MMCSVLLSLPLSAGQVTLDVCVLQHTVLLQHANLPCLRSLSLLLIITAVEIVTSAPEICHCV
jgi:hypothetical protein